MNASAEGTGAAAPIKPVSPAYRGYVLFILVLVYTFNFLDRQIIGILAVPIQAELDLSDTQLGLMGGIAFAILYSTIAIPIAWLADRTNRVWIMTIALTVWSGMTAVCGLTQNFWQLFLARVGVGVGEAGGVAPAYTIIADYFPPDQRARALAIYSFGIPIGSAVGIIFGGVIATLIDWRAAFIIVGLLGVALAPIFRLTVREPQRGAFDVGGPKARPVAAPASGLGKRIAVGALIGALAFLAFAIFVSLIIAATGGGFSISIVYLYAMGTGAFIGANLGFVWDVTRVLLKKWRSFIMLSFGAAASSMMGYGLFFWIPGLIVRTYPEELRAFFSWAPTWLAPEGSSVLLLAAYFYGTIVLIGGVIGIALGGVLGDFLGGRNKANYAIVPAIAFLITAPVFMAAVMTPNLTLAFFLYLVPTALGLAWLGPVLTAFQHLVEPHMRATASATFLLINNLLGIGGGVYALGAMSDAFQVRFGDESLRYSMLVGACLYFVAAGLFLLASRRIAHDWVD